MNERRQCMDMAEDIGLAIESNGRRAGFESERARTWGWFIAVQKEDTSYWEWMSPCSSAETFLFRQLFAEEKICGEPKPTQTGMCILAI